MSTDGTSPSPEKVVIPRHLRPHATFGDDPSGWCACAGCEPSVICDCQSCREVFRPGKTTPITPTEETP